MILLVDVSIGTQQGKHISMFIAIHFLVSHFSDFYVTVSGQLFIVHYDILTGGFLELLKKSTKNRCG